MSKEFNIALSFNQESADQSQLSAIEELKNQKKLIIRELIQKLLRKMKRNERNLSSMTITSPYSYNVNRGALACFAELCSVISFNHRITELNLSGCNINIYFAIELANLIQNHTNIQVLHLAGCNLNPFSLSCLFKAMADHTGLQQLNLFNNQSFTLPVIQDFCKYVLKGKNQLTEINLNHCNIDSYGLSLLLPNIIYLKTLKSLKIGMMQFSSESILALSSAMSNYTGDRSLEYLDLSNNQIQHDGIKLLSGALFISVRQINIKSINLARNFIKQDSVEDLEQILLKLNVEEVNLSQNFIKEFQNPQVLTKKMFRINLSSNKFDEIPNNFFLNVISINLANNLINTQGAYQISQVLTSKKVQWRELNLNNNQIYNKGFISLIFALTENQKLTNLMVANNNINGEGILVYIFNHEQLNLQFLDLSSNIMRYDIVYALISMMKECKLKSLLLSSLKQDENEIHSMKTELFEIKCANLREIDFSDNRMIISPIIESLAKQFNRIEYLNLNNNNLTKHHLIQLSQFVQKSYTLQTLCLAYNFLGHFDEVDLTYLENGLSKCFSLTNLDLSNNRLKNKILCFINLSNCPNLVYLNLANNLIDENEDIISKFPLLMRNPNLAYVDLSKNSIRAQTLLQIKYVLHKEHKQFPLMNLSFQKFTADDLVGVSEIICDSYSFKSVELAGNMQLDYLNNVLTFGDSVKVESLSINKIQFRKDTFVNLLSVIELNRKSLKILEISNTFLSNNQLLQLLQSLRVADHLVALFIDYQDISSTVLLNEFQQLIPKLRQLKNLRMRKCTLGLYFFDIIMRLLKRSNKLIELDLSDNKFTYEALQLIVDGLIENQSVVYLNLSNCKITDGLFDLIIQCLELNETIKELDLSENNITEASFQSMKREFSLASCKLQVLKLNHSQGNFLLEYNNEQQQSITFNYLTKLELYKNEITLSSLHQLMLNCKSSFQFQHLTCLILDQCKIDNNHCQVLQQIVLKDTKLSQLSLSKNLITEQGFAYIFDPIIRNESNLKILNVSKNMITDGYFFKLAKMTETIAMDCLQLLLFDSNGSDGSGTSGFIKIFQDCPQLYIYNDWKNITQELSVLIIESYMRFTQQFNMTGDIPYFISSLRIEDSELSDTFYIWLGSIYFRFSKLDYLNLNGSKNITSIGMIHLYINMVNETSCNANQRDLYFQGQINFTSKIFDEGIITCFLMRMKNWFQNTKKSTITTIKYNSVESQFQESIKWGFIGKWIIHLINKVLTYLQGVQIDFRLSNQLHRYLRKRKTKVKAYLIITIVLEVIKYLLTTLLIFHFLKFYQDVESISNAPQLGNYSNLMSFFFIVLIQSLVNLYVSIKLRQNSKPDYCTLTQDVRRYIISNHIHQIELWYFIFQFFVFFSFYFEIQIAIDCVLFIKYINTAQPHLNYLKAYLIISIVFCATWQFFQIVQYLIFGIKSTRKLLRDYQTDQATFYKSLWMVAVSLNNYQIQKVIKYFCPQTGLRIKKILYNQLQIFELGKAFIQCLSYFVMFRFFFQYSDEINLSSNLNFMILSYLGALKNLIEFLFHILYSITTRPPSINEFDLNEVFLLRRHQQLGDLQNQLVYNLLKKTSHRLQTNLQSSQMHITKQSSFDLKFSNIKALKSERVIVKQKSKNPQQQLMIHSPFIEDEVLTHNVEDQQSIQIPFLIFPNQSLKGLAEKYDK